MFSAPLRYVQGPGALDTLGALLAGRHDRVVVLVDALLVDRLHERLATSLRDAGVVATIHPNEGEVTQSRIDALTGTVRRTDPSVVVAVGGGKTLDTGKGVARNLGIGVVTVPTIASNDGPTSRVIALYDDEHRLIDTPRLAQNPEAVVVDTQLICEAPARFLVSGIGDAIAKRFEAAACRRGTGLTSNGTRPLELPGLIADACYDVLLADAATAVADVTIRELSSAVERVVEAVVLMSGLAFENGGLSLAHSMTRGLMAVPESRRHLHGHHVAYGLLVQLVHEGDLEEGRRLAALFRQIDLPRSLRDLGADPDADTIRTIVDATLAAPHAPNFSPTATSQSLTDAVLAVESAR
jgi:glycerol dehydrogenase